MLNPHNHHISYLSGMFSDKSLEQKFQESYLNRSRNHFRKCALIIGTLFFSFLIYDFASNRTYLSLRFNDENGHSFGDKVLKELACLVKESIRGMDIFARWGGEEFVILLPQTHCKEATALAERIRDTIYKDSLKKKMDLTCSFGVTSFSNQDDQELILERVDRALYKAKERGRNLVVTECNSQGVSEN